MAGRVFCRNGLRSPFGDDSSAVPTTSGPMSMIQSAARMMDVSCSTTSTELPLSQSRWSMVIDVARMEPHRRLIEPPQWSQPDEAESATNWNSAKASRLQAQHASVRSTLPSPVATTGIWS